MPSLGVFPRVRKLILIPMSPKINKQILIENCRPNTVFKSFFVSLVRLIFMVSSTLSGGTTFLKLSFNIKS